MKDPRRGARRVPSIPVFCAVALIAAVARPGAAQDAPRSPDATGDLDLRDAVELAVLHHPALAATSWEVRAREAEAAQAGSRPNPELALDVENVAGTGAVRGLDGAETTLLLSQVLELGGKRAQRVRAANLDRDLAAWDRELERIDVATDTAIAFTEVLASQQRLALADTLLGVAEQVLASVSRRVQAGGISSIEERRARVALETDRVDRDRARRELDTARFRLASRWGVSNPTFRWAVGDLERIEEIPPLGELEARRDQAPDLARWATELERRRAAGRRAASGRTPDLGLSVGLRRFADSRDSALLFGVRLPLPLLDRKDGARRAAESRVRAGEREKEAAALRVHTELREAHATLAWSRDEALALRQRILPEAAAAFTEATEAYREGRLRFTDVLDTKRTFFELRVRLLDVLAIHHATVARLERLLGAPLRTAVDPEDS